MKQKKNILVVTGWSFNDALVQTYTLPYVKIIKNILPPESKIYLFTQRQKSYYLNFDYNQNQIKSLEKDGIYVIESNYYNFGIKALIYSLFALLKLTFVCFTKDIKYIHAWCTPAGSIGYILSILTGKKLILDSYEPHAEAMVENGTWTKNSLAFKVLFKLERLQTKRAEVCVGLTTKTPDYALKTYGVKIKEYFTKPACVDFELFSSSLKKDFSLINEPNDCDKVICIYAGKIGGIYLEKEIFEFFQACNQYWKGNFKAVLLSNSNKDIIEKYAAQFGINDGTIFHKEVHHKEVSKYMALANFALNPVKPVPTKRYCTSIKDGEYWAMGLPVVITKNISDDSDIIESERIGSVINSFDSVSYFNAIDKIDKIITTSEIEVRDKIINVAKRYRSFSIAEKVYSKVY